MANIKIGDTLPCHTFITKGNEGVEKVSSKAIFTGRSVMIVGVIGAFTPVCTGRHLPEFIPYSKELKKHEIVDEVICLSVADPFVLEAWGKQLGAMEDIVMLTDTNAEFAKVLGLDIDLSSIGLGVRNTRYAMLVEDNVVMMLNIEKHPQDVDLTSVEGVKKALDQVD